MTSYLIYTDDSGDEISSFYSALLVPMDSWSKVLRQWLKFRKWLYNKHEVPADYELHTYQWLKGQGEPVPDKPDHLANTSEGLRREIAEKALKQIRVLHQNGVRLLTCETQGAVKADAYRALIDALDAELEKEQAWGVVVVDGGKDGAPDPHVRAAHRSLKLDSRRVVEDGWLQPAQASQLVQMADLLVHCAYQAARRKPGRRFMWDWYPKHLHDLELTCNCP
ncbi:hypothetical protein AB0F46_40200 [Streptomyces sp. NPDC026665]|uniref:hypothetical protein n=1 Tax=Streptomyces sp. NPDC026665 TaxID=3154798 RepID=UPI0033C77621